MALVNCFECGNVISDEARFCPHCGMPYESSHDEIIEYNQRLPPIPPLRRKRNQSLMNQIAALILLVMISGIMIATCVETDESNERDNLRSTASTGTFIKDAKLKEIEEAEEKRHEEYLKKMEQINKDKIESLEKSKNADQMLGFDVYYPLEKRLKIAKDIIKRLDTVLKDSILTFTSIRTNTIKDQHISITLTWNDYPETDYEYEAVTSAVGGIIVDDLQKAGRGPSKEWINIHIWAESYYIDANSNIINRPVGSSRYDYYNETFMWHPVK
jgi:hypothetical protein